MNSSMATILAFGFHDRKSPRHSTVCEELTKNGGTVIECHTEARGFFAKCADLRKKFSKAMSAENPDSPLTVLVPFPGHFLMPLAWLLTRRPRRRLIFDAFISLYDTDISDRRRCSPWHPWAWVLWMSDWLSMYLADEVLIDTEEHRKFLIKTFHLQPEHMKVIYLQARKDLFYPARNPRPETRSRFEVFFYGTMIPLQGVDYILDAAKILEERNAPVHFTLVGSEKIRHMVEGIGLKNVTSRGFVPMEQLPEMIRASDLCLGIFGTSGKAQRVIPHKVVDAVACGVPVLMGDTPAMRERYADHPLVHLVPTGNAQAIADEIMEALSS